MELKKIVAIVRTQVLGEDLELPKRLELSNMI